MVDLNDLGARVEAELYRRGAKLEAGQLRMACVNPHHHGDRRGDARYTPEKQAWCCYVCGAKGGLLVGAVPLATALGIEGAGEWTDEQRAQWAADAAEAHAEAEAHKARMAMAVREYWDARRDFRTAEARGRVSAYLAAGGISADAAEYFNLAGGEWKHRPALVIPWSSGGVVNGIQYRFMGGTGRYETHPGSVLKIYNADAVKVPTEDQIIIVEGAKKCAAVWSKGVGSVCAVRNKGGWNPAWAPNFAAFGRVVFALDPDAVTEARDAARTVRNGYVAYLPMKPDDLLMATRGDPTPLMDYIDRAERMSD